MNSNFCIETEYRFYIEGKECIPGDALNIELNNGSILKEAVFDSTFKNNISIDFYGIIIEIPIEDIVALEKVI